MARLKVMSRRIAELPRRKLGDAGLTKDVVRAQSNPMRRLYSTARWRKLRQKILKRDGWQCQKTGVMVIGKSPAPNSAVVDHIKPHRNRVALFWDESNLQTVSKQYHDNEKQKLEQAGLA